MKLRLRGEIAPRRGVLRNRENHRREMPENRIVSHAPRQRNQNNLRAMLEVEREMKRAILAPGRAALCEAPCEKLTFERSYEQAIPEVCVRAIFCYRGERRRRCGGHETICRRRHFYRKKREAASSGDR